MGLMTTAVGCQSCRSVGAQVKTAESSALAHLALEFLDADKGHQLFFHGPL